MAPWGNGTPRREFLHVDDLGRAVVHLLDVYDEPEHINVGVSEDVSIRELAEIVADVVGFRGEIVQDTSRPDGTPRKLLDVSRVRALAGSRRSGCGRAWRARTAGSSSTGRQRACS